MIALHGARNLGAVMVALLAMLMLAACSNGRGSVGGGEQQTAGFTVGGAVSGLAGSGLVLQLNGGGDLPVAGNGAFAFPGSLAPGAAYEVTIRTQPANPAQTCSVSSGAGRIAAANVTNVAVVCTSGSTAFTVGGVVTGLRGSGLILRNNGAEDLPISADGEFIFPTVVATGAAYEVTVASPPANPAQTCTVENGRGVMGSDDVTTVRVICSTTAFTIGGSVSGLARLGLRLRNNDEVLAIGADGAFTFRTPVASGASYSVSIESQPQDQSCIVSNGAGTVQNANVTNVTVNCASSMYAIGGVITGLAPNARVSFRLTVGGERLEAEANRNGPFAFNRHFPNGTAYVVEVLPSTRTPAQRCEPASTAGVIANADVSIAYTCTTLQFTVGGTVQGVQGPGLVLRLNGAATNQLAIAGDGSFTFPAPIESGRTYEVSVFSNPSSPPQTCTVQNGSGTVGAANVTNVQVRCALNSYTIGGSVSGLAAGARVVLQNNGADSVEVVSGGAFTFPTPVVTGGTYNVTVLTQPTNPRQACTVTNGAGTVGVAPITNVAVSCQNVYVVGGSVSGLAASGLQLRLNGAETITINASGGFTFATALTSGATYTVEIVGQGSLPAQTCVVANGSGTIGAADVTNVAITCTTNTYTIGGSVSGLQGVGLSLQLNGGAFMLVSNGPFTFPTQVASGSTYSVTITSQPIFPQQTCSVTNGAGTVGAANVVDVVVNCP